MTSLWIKYIPRIYSTKIKSYLAYGANDQFSQKKNKIALNVSVIYYNFVFVFVFFDCKLPDSINVSNNQLISLLCLLPHQKRMFILILIVQFRKALLIRWIISMFPTKICYFNPFHFIYYTFISEKMHIHIYSSLARENIYIPIGKQECVMFFILYS